MHYFDVYREGQNTLLFWINFMKMLMNYIFQATYYLEYEEKITEIFSKETAELIIGAFTLLDNIKKSDIHFHLNLISVDPDDNKFSDCAFASNAHYLVTDDKHFNVLKSLSFPAMNVIKLAQFKEILRSL